MYAVVGWGRQFAVLVVALLLWGGLATAPAVAQNAQVQLIHNAAGFGDVDVYVLDATGSELAKLDDFPFRGALVFDVPAGEDLTLTVNGAESSDSDDAQVASVSPVNLTQGSFNQAFAVGQDPSDFEVLLKPEQSTGAAPNTVDLLVGHQAPDVGAVDVLTRGFQAVDGLTYKSFAPSAADTYVAVPVDNYIVRVGPDDNSSFVGSFSAPLQDLGLGGSTLTVLASGFLSPSGGGPALGVIAVPPLNASTSADEIAEASNADANVTLLPAAPSPQPLVINEFFADPASGDDPNGDGSAGGDDEEEFVEIVNNTGGPVDLGGYELVDAADNTYTFPEGTSVPDGEAATIFGGGTPTGVPGFTDTGLPALNNGGDDIILRNEGGSPIDQVTYADPPPFSPVQEGVSTTRAPDFTGPMALSSAVGPDFTPGQTNDGGTNLPVELADFSARLDGEDALLTWRTLSETTNSGFAVQHRVGDGAFERVGFREGQGSTTEATAYRFRVDDLRAGAHAFRLKQIDVDGSASLTDVVTVEVALDEAFTWTRVAPNPVSGTGALSMRVQETQEVTVELYDVLGRRVRTLHDGPMPSGGRHQMTLDTGALAGGTYLLRVDGESFSDTQRVTVVK